MKRFYLIIIKYLATNKRLFLPIVLIPMLAVANAQEVRVSETKTGHFLSVSLQNGYVKQTVVIQDSVLCSDTLQSLLQWTDTFNHRQPAVLVTDAGFELDVVYTAWRAPGKEYNADNPVSFDKNNFSFDKFTVNDSLKDAVAVDFWFTGTNNPFTLQMTYQLKPGEFFVRRKITLTDKTLTGHYLNKIHSRQGKYFFYDLENANASATFTINVEGYEYANEIDRGKGTAGIGFEIIHTGDFGQPVALKSKEAGVFGGIEYPTSDNFIYLQYLDFYQYLGQQIKDKPVGGNWTVLGITPEPYVKKWFYEYVKNIRVAPAKPYILYNSWYDLRSADYPNVPEDAVMNEKNVQRIWNLVKENFIEKNNIKIDAFVLDDGWDVYASAWELRKKQFPNGLRSLADEMEKSGTTMGIWFGPSGGYSFAMKRIRWMHDHGYEVTGNVKKYGSAQLCLAGTNYSKLFRERTTDFVKNYHIGYFKWDGIQFSCSEPDHGHPVGIHSRRAIMESVIDKCQAVRAINPDVYLNITSGTWLSPWWVQYANQIWMDAADYAFADVPSITRRDNAMTYRDYALFDDEHIRKSWFPVSNLMIHGIIKGRLENITKGGETIETFTNNAVFYFARGISMWELYISPDILTDKEWSAISQSIKWAEDRANILSRTFMVGKNPAMGNTYAYLHFTGNHGIIAARNPKIDEDFISVTLDPEYGIDENATGLIIEQVYPKRYIFPQIYAAGARFNIPLEGYETAIFEVYPLACKDNMPLIAGVPFQREIVNGEVIYTLLNDAKEVKLLNPETVKSMQVNDQNVSLTQLNQHLPDPVTLPEYTMNTETKKDKTIMTLTSSSVEETKLVALLLKAGSDNEEEDFPLVNITRSGKSLIVKKQSVEGKWIWYVAEIPTGTKPDIRLTISRGNWKGTAELWVRSSTRSKGKQLVIRPAGKVAVRPMPPLPYPAGTFMKYRQVGKIVME